MNIKFFNYTHAIEYNSARSCDRNIVADHNHGKRVRLSILHAKWSEIKNENQISE